MARYQCKGNRPVALTARLLPLDGFHEYDTDYSNAVKLIFRLSMNSLSQNEILRHPTFGWPPQNDVKLCQIPTSITNIDTQHLAI